MLAKKNRADTKIVEKVFKVGKFINSSILSFKFKLNSGSSLPRVSFIAPKNMAKKAVDRNTLRRLGYQALQKQLSNLPAGLEGAFVFKKIPSSIEEIEHEIQTILTKIH